MTHPNAECHRFARSIEYQVLVLQADEAEPPVENGAATEAEVVDACPRAKKWRRKRLAATDSDDKNIPETHIGMDLCGITRIVKGVCKNCILTFSFESRYVLFR